LVQSVGVFAASKDEKNDNPDKYDITSLHTTRWEDNSSHGHMAMFYHRRYVSAQSASTRDLFLYTFRFDYRAGIYLAARFNFIRHRNSTVYPVEEAKSKAIFPA